MAVWRIFFSGCARLFALIVGQRKRGREAPERGEGVEFLHFRECLHFLAFFCIFGIQIERSGAHFG